MRWDLKAAQALIAFRMMGSALQVHPSAVVIADEEAASGLVKKEFHIHAETALAALSGQPVFAQE